MLLLLLLAQPDLTELQRFPRLDAANGRLGVLIEQRYFIRLQLSLDRKNAERWARALRENDLALACWEALLEAWGGLLQEEGGAGDEDTCRRALSRLRKLLGEDRWASGEMP
jgi:hypothetical protein